MSALLDDIIARIHQEQDELDEHDARQKSSELSERGKTRDAARRPEHSTTEYHRIAA